MLKQATTVAAASLVAVFMTGCASLPDLYKGGKKDNVCKPGDTYQECCEKRELKKPLKYRFGGACDRNGGGNDRDHGGQNTPDRGSETPGTGGGETPGTGGGGQPDSEGPSDQGRGNTGHDHSNDGKGPDGDKGGDRDGGPGQGDKGGDKGEGKSDQGRGNNDGDKNDSRDGGPGQGPGGRGDVGGRDHSALKVVRPSLA